MREALELGFRAHQVYEQCGRRVASDGALATNDFYATAALLMLGLIALAWAIRRPRGPLKAVAH